MEDVNRRLPRFDFNAAANQGLSERRAASVKNYRATAGIDASRLTTVGYGQEKQVAPNDNPIGKAQNRRVKLVKQ